MKHIAALIGITVFVFGTIFLFTHDWAGGQPTEEMVAVADQSPAPQEAAPTAVTESAPVNEALLTAGQSEYAVCQGCHGPDGEGGPGPAFVENANLADPDFVIETILFGREAMPAFGDLLDDEQVAAVATYIRNSWGNEFGGVEIEDVAVAHEAGAVDP